MTKTLSLLCSPKDRLVMSEVSRMLEGEGLAERDGKSGKKWKSRDVMSSRGCRGGLIGVKILEVLFFYQTI
ncbi:hypothetical protein HID58_089452 [Brassica napus]|uniref:Uncharacterized protein n=2 Tax=Brassica TaxID=3705 RepID=A0ABQ7Y1T0_BRANA|nr:hypothetical protein HID58_089452 [Brassica napus]